MHYVIYIGVTFKETKRKSHLGGRRAVNKWLEKGETKVDLPTFDKIMETEQVIYIKDEYSVSDLELEDVEEEYSAEDNQISDSDDPLRLDDEPQIRQPQFACSTSRLHHRPGSNIQHFIKMQNLDEILVPFTTWMEAGGTKDLYDAGKLLFGKIFSSRECLKGSISGRHCEEKLCPIKQLAILRALSWISFGTGGVFIRNQPLQMVLPKKVIDDLISRLFSSHRNQLNIKIGGRRRKNRRPDVVLPETTTPVTDEYRKDIYWAENSSIPRDAWAEAFIEMLTDNASRAATVLFNSLFPEEEQLISTLKGTREKGTKKATFPLDTRRCNGIVLICRWMLANKLNYPYSFSPLGEEELMQTSLNKSEQYIKKVFTDQPNQRRQEKKKRNRDEGNYVGQTTDNNGLEEISHKVFRYGQ